MNEFLVISLKQQVRLLWTPNPPKVRGGVGLVPLRNQLVGMSDFPVRLFISSLAY